MGTRKKYYNPDDPRDAEDLMNYLEALESDDEITNKIDTCDELDLILLPPLDGEDTDKDDAKSDAEGETNFRDLGKGVLAQQMEVTTRKIANKFAITSTILSRNTNTSSDDDSDNEPLSEKAKRLKISKKKHRKRSWTRKDLLPREGKLQNPSSTEPAIVAKIKNEHLKPIDIFRLFFDENFMQYICDESQKYAASKGFHEFRLSKEDLYKYFGILLLSGYCKVPFRRNYWETRSDTFNSLVASAMARNRFESIHRFLHLNDNSKIDKNDKIYKVRPLIDHLNVVFQKCAEPLGSWFSLDEAMEPYYGHHSMKQFIRGKPIRYGYKFWCLCLSTGYLLKFLAYTGAGDKQQGLSLGSSVTEKLCLGYLPKNSTLFIDNYFNSLPLLENLKENNIICVGTIRADRTEKAPLLDLKREKRGSYDTLTDDNSGIVLVKWHDNNQVTMASNMESRAINFTKTACTRWCKKEKKYISVDQPSLVNLYNKGMGGVDLFDNMRGLYRISIRSNKWYWPLIRFCINGAVVNMWYIYRHIEPNIKLLEFIRRIVLSILANPDKPSVTGPKPKTKKQILEEVRYDGKEHWIVKIQTQRRCGFCGKCTMFICEKCNFGLHPDSCFKIFHTRN